MKLTLIAAMDEARLLANARGIPWKLPRDVAHFRAYTRNKWLLLGRRTFEEMRGWFREGHMPLVLTAQCSYEPSIGRAVDSVPNAMALAESAKQTELVVCGGAQVYAAALPFVQEMILTMVQHRFPSDNSAKFLPAFSADEWQCCEQQSYAADSANEWPMTISRWHRR